MPSGTFQHSKDDDFSISDDRPDLGKLPDRTPRHRQNFPLTFIEFDQIGATKATAARDGGPQTLLQCGGACDCLR